MNGDKSGVFEGLLRRLFGLDVVQQLCLGRSTEFW